MADQPNPRQELDGILDRNKVGSGYRSQLIGNFEDYVRDISLAGQAEELTSLEARLKTAQECALALDQSREELFSRVRDAEDARKAAVGLLEKQNLELVRLKAAQARVRALHTQAADAVNPWCGRCNDLAPCPTLQALDA